MHSKRFLTLCLIATASAASMVPTTLSTDTSPVVTDSAPSTTAAPLANTHLAAVPLATRAEPGSVLDDIPEDMTQKMARVLDLTLIAMSEERHIVNTDLLHFNPWDSIDKICSMGYEHEGGMSVDQKPFYRELRFQLHELKRMKEEAKGPPPCTTIIVELEGSKTTNIECPTSTMTW
ncbi:hypothetical protein N0V95_000370 [Ascochyta clinopodiicola]|nr:hypothetical protein N0V95_000370 [Ascochyta clinopodiicola]